MLTTYFCTPPKNKAVLCIALFFGDQNLMGRAIAVIFIGVVKAVTSAEK
jgi:hypothetical protein